MRVACHCGSRMLVVEWPTSAIASKCGIRCCSACAYSLEVSHVLRRLCRIHPRCAGRARSTLSRTSMRRTRASIAATNGARQRPHTSRASDSAQWLILVAKDQADLYGHLVSAFSRDDKVQILLDRRRDYSRDPPRRGGAPSRVRRAARDSPPRRKLEKRPVCGGTAPSAAVPRNARDRRTDELSSAGPRHGPALPLRDYASRAAVGRRLGIWTFLSFLPR